LYLLLLLPLVIVLLIKIVLLLLRIVLFSKQTEFFKKSKGFWIKIQLPVIDPFLKIFSKKEFITNISPMDYPIIIEDDEIDEKQRL
jgi:hypothetical protein